MITTNKSRTRGRPRQFDPEQAVAIAQRLFHSRGYDVVSVSDMTDALGINPPSFYAAFGNKAGLYARVLERYTTTGAIPFAELLSDDRDVADGLALMLEEAAKRYGADPQAPGCLVIEGSRCNDADARTAANALQQAAQQMIRDYIAARHPQQADRVTDFISTVMAGMSASARNGHDVNRLLASARLASRAIATALSGDDQVADRD